MGTGKWYVGPPVSILAIYYTPLYMLVSATLLALCIRPPSGEMTRGAGRRDEAKRCSTLHGKRSVRVA